MPQSPIVSPDEPERPTGFPGAKLKYTQTVMAGKSGGLGLRVHGKRASTSNRLSKSGVQAAVLQHSISPSSLAQEPASSSSITTKEITAAVDRPKTEEANVPSPLTKIVTETSSSRLEVTVEAPSANEEAPVQKVVQFVPKFKGAAEMERRRRVRMAARLELDAALAPPLPPQPFTISSSEDELQPHSSHESLDDSDFGSQRAHDTVDEADEFDP